MKDIYDKLKRNFFRLHYLKIVSFQIMVEKNGLPFSNETYSGIIRDLSGGGMKMVTTIDIPKNKLIKLKLRIDNEIFELFGEISFKRYNKKAVQPYTYGIMFLDISEGVKKNPGAFALRSTKIDTV